MASLTQLLFFSLLFSISLPLSNAQTTSSKSKALLLPVSKDSATLQYIAHMKLGTPFVQKRLVLDLGGTSLWIDCETGYQSSTYKPAHCGTAACSVAKADCVSSCITPPKPGCNDNTCKVLTENTVRGTYQLSEIALDTVSLLSTDGSKTGSPVSVSNFIFACADSFHLDELARGVQGMLGLTRDNVAMPAQLSSAFGGSFRRKFAICLPSTPKSNGVLFFGESPYVFYPGYNKSKSIDVSYRFTYTKLYLNYVRTASPRVQGAISPEYFVKVTSIWVNKKPIPINTTLLEFRRTGIGGSKITTIQPYTVLETSIYKSLVKVFDKETAGHWNVSKVAPVAPFKDCYSDTGRGMGMTLLGVDVPDIAFVFENKNVYWELYGANSMVEVSKDVVCLAFLDGGSDTTTPIVIGAHQMQDNLFQFDLAASRLGFTSTLLFEEVECSNFKF